MAEKMLLPGRSLTNVIPQPSCPELQQATHALPDDSLDNRLIYQPNPFEDDFTLVVDSDLQSTAEVAVYDMEGHPLVIDMVETNTPHQLGKNWKEGLYILRITVDGQIMFKRVIKERH